MIGFYALGKSTCREKLAFKKRRDAEKEASSASKLYGHQMKYYKCHHCGCFHLTKEKQFS